MMEFTAILLSGRQAIAAQDGGPLMEGALSFLGVDGLLTGRATLADKAAFVLFAR